MIDRLTSFEDDLVDQETEWITADARRIKIRNMSDRHLLNTICMLRNRSPIGTTYNSLDPRLRRRFINAMANEAYSRGLALEELEDGEPIHE